MNPAILDRGAHEVWKTVDETNWAKIVLDIVSSYEPVSRPLVKELQEALANKNLTRIEFLAHNLKSASGNVGAMKANDLFQKLELAANTGVLTAFDDMKEKVGQVFEETVVELSHYIAELQKTGGANER